MVGMQLEESLDGDIPGGDVGSVVCSLVAMVPTFPVACNQNISFVWKIAAQANCLQIQCKHLMQLALQQPKPSKGLMQPAGCRECWTLGWAVMVPIQFSL